MVFWLFFSDSESRREDIFAVIFAVILCRDNCVLNRTVNRQNGSGARRGTGPLESPFWRAHFGEGAIEVVYGLCWRRVPVIGVCAKQTISGRRIPPRGVLAKSDKVVLVLSETVLVLVIEFRKVEIMVLSA